MSRIGEWLKKAEHLARGHSKQADQLLDRAERFAKERTGHKYDKHIEKGVDTVQRRYGGGTRAGDEPQPDQTGRDQTGSAQTGSAQTGPAQTGPAQGTPEQGRSGQGRPGQARPERGRRGT